MSQTLQDLDTWLVAGGTWLEDMYERWQLSPDAVSEYWQCFFDNEALGADLGLGHQAKLQALSHHSRLQQGTQSVEIRSDVDAVELFLLHPLN